MCTEESSTRLNVGQEDRNYEQKQEGEVQSLLPQWKRESIDLQKANHGNCDCGKSQQDKDYISEFPILQHTYIPVLLLDIRIDVWQQLTAYIGRILIQFADVTIAQEKMPAKWSNYNAQHSKSFSDFLKTSYIPAGSYKAEQLDNHLQPNNRRKKYSITPKTHRQTQKYSRIPFVPTFQ